MENLRLKAARAALDMSQAELAKRVNVSRQTIVAIEMCIRDRGCCYLIH